MKTLLIDDPDANVSFTVKYYFSLASNNLVVDSCTNNRTGGFVNTRPFQGKSSYYGNYVNAVLADHIKTRH